MFPRFHDRQQFFLQQQLLQQQTGMNYHPNGVSFFSNPPSAPIQNPPQQHYIWKATPSFISSNPHAVQPFLYVQAAPFFSPSPVSRLVQNYPVVTVPHLPVEKQMTEQSNVESEKETQPTLANERAKIKMAPNTIQGVNSNKKKKKRKKLASSEEEDEQPMEVQIEDDEEDNDDDEDYEEGDDEGEPRYRQKKTKRKINRRKLKRRFSSSSISSKSSNNSHDKQIDDSSKGEGDGMNLNGEKRLVINFDSYGKIGKHLQTYGRKGGAVIPDGLSGTHSMYNERWKFEIKHENDQSFEENGKVCVCITWKIINLTTGKVHTATETKKEAVFRMLNGRTISSRLFKEALDHRARELEEELSSTDSSNELRIKNLKAKIRHLKPKRFSEGTLTFGLQHEAVQAYVMAKQER